VTYQRSIHDEPVTIHSDLAGWDDFVASDSLFGLDVETTATMTDARMFGDGFAVRLVQFGTEHQAYVLDPDRPDHLAAITALLTDPEKRFVTHTNYDSLCVWAGFGIALGQRVVDTHVLASLLEPGERTDKTLKSLCEEWIDAGLRLAETALHKTFWSIIPAGSGLRKGSSAAKAYGFNNVSKDDESFIVYAGLDAIYVRRLFPILLHECSEFPALVRQEFWLAAQTTGITIRGLRLDKDTAQRAYDEIEAEIADARKEIESLTGFAALSPKRVGWLSERGVKFEKMTEKGNPSLDKDSLPLLMAKYQDGEVGQMLAATYVLSQKTNTKSNLGSFLSAVGTDGKVHPDIKTLKAHTGRMSITNPALQTLKKADPRLRSAFIADEGMVLIGCDFKNVELRVAAGLSGETRMIKVFETGGDLHSETARLIYNDGFTDKQRAIGKMANFLTAYGGGAKALHTQGRIPLDQAQNVIKKFRAAYPAIAQYGWNMGEVTGNVVNDAQRHIPVDPDRTYANSNYMIQSVSRDLLVEAAARFVIDKGYTDALWLLVHDEIVIQVPANQSEQAALDLQAAMTTTYRGVTIEADVTVLGDRWGKVQQEQEIAA
jgi:DNA polymerase-1